MGNGEFWLYKAAMQDMYVLMTTLKRWVGLFLGGIWSVSYTRKHFLVLLVLHVDGDRIVHIREETVMYLLRNI